MSLLGDAGSMGPGGAVAAIVCRHDVTVGDLAWDRALVPAQELKGQQRLTGLVCATRCHVPRAQELGRGSGKRDCNWEAAGQPEGRRKGLILNSSQRQEVSPLT